MGGEFEVVLALPLAVAARLGLELDEEDAVAPEHSLVWGAEPLVVMPCRQFQLVDEDAVSDVDLAEGESIHTVEVEPPRRRGHVPVPPPHWAAAEDER